MMAFASTRLRLAHLRLMRAIGVRRFIATSSFGYPFVCHVGDRFGENPYYDASLFAPELHLAAAWLLQEDKPVVIDAGGNVGFWCTQLAQLAGASSPTIYSFEPVPHTMCKLGEAVARLGLEDRIRPVPAALSDGHRLVAISVDPSESGFAQVSARLNERAGKRLELALAIPLDHFLEQAAARPSLLKIDVEGGEAEVLQGARHLLERQPPAVLLELNPLTLQERGLSPGDVTRLLPAYDFHYVDDFEGQRMPFGEPVEKPEALGWVCNLFAVPRSQECSARFAKARDVARGKLASHGTR